MSELGRFLERFYGPDETFRTVHARVRHSQRVAATHDASSGRRGAIGRRRRDAKQQVETEDKLEFWARLPHEVRFEAERTKDGKKVTTIEVVNVDSAWKRHADGTVEMASARHGRRHEGVSFPTEFQRHFDRCLLRECFAALTLKEVGKCRVANRDCLKIRAVQVPGAQLWPHWFSFEASQFEFAADVDRAVLLSIVCLVGEETVETHEVVEVEFDEKLDDILFVYEPGDEETVQAAIPVTEHITLEAAAARAPFVVLRPTYLPESDRVQSEAFYEPARPSSKEESLTIFYRGGDSFDTLWINQSNEQTDNKTEELEWEEFVVDGRRLKISEPESEQGLQVLAGVHDGTRVDVVSDLPRHEMVRIALSLEPVRNQANGAANPGS